MGVSTIGCVVTDCKDVFKVSEAICFSINSLIKEKSGLDGIQLLLSENVRKPVATVYAEIMVVSFDFLFLGEERSLKVHFDCDYDLRNHEELDGHSCLWLNLGNWGSSVVIMESVLNGLKQFGKTYIDTNDCDDVGFQEVV